MSSTPPPLSAAGAGQPSRSSSCFVAKPARGFQVLRIDGYSWTKSLPGGERITSEPFAVGGRLWCVDYYPNGADASRDDSDAVALYLRLVGVADGYHNQQKLVERVRAQYKFTLLDLAGNAAYERAAETGVFTVTPVAAGSQAALLTGRAYASAIAAGAGAAGVRAAAADGVGCGYASFIAREELERLRGKLLGEDCLAIRCDVGVTEVASLVAAGNPLAAKIYRDLVPGGGYNYGVGAYPQGYNGGGGETYTLGGGPRAEPPPDDKEFIRRCLAAKRARE